MLLPNVTVWRGIGITILYLLRFYFGALGCGPLKFDTCTLVGFFIHQPAVDCAAWKPDQWNSRLPCAVVWRKSPDTESTAIAEERFELTYILG